MSRWGISFFLTLLYGAGLFYACQSGTKEEEVVMAAADSVSGSSFIDPQSCKPCHAAIVDQYLQTGKGRSFYPADEQWVVENWDAKPVYDKHLDFYYLPYRKSGEFFVREFRLSGADTVHKRVEKIDFFIGSGNQTRSFLYQRNGYLFEIPVTWYSKKRIWDLSPGYENGQNSRFDREIGEACMQCHNSGFQFKVNSLNRYRHFGHALDCGSCHGELDAHLKSALEKGSENKVLPVSLHQLPLQAQFDVCRQCHLEGIKVRKNLAKPGQYAPGKLLSDFDEVFIPTSGESAEFGFASHAERLQQSVCFRQSNGKMNCTTCHNPHASSQVGDDFYNASCRNCHAQGHEKQCLVNKAPTANCKSCHMAVSGTTDIPHVNSTDHLIRRHIKDENKAESGKQILKNFTGNQLNEKDLWSAKLQFAETHADTSMLNEIARFVHELSLEEQVKYFYLSNQEWKEKLDTNGLMGSKNPMTLFYWSQLKRRAKLPSALSTLEKACRLAPEMVDFWYHLAVFKAELGLESASAYQKVIELLPVHTRSLSALGFLYLQQKHYAEAETHLKRAMVTNPDYILARENLARLFIEQGRFDQAKKELNLLRQKNPDENRYQQILESLP